MRSSMEHDIARGDAPGLIAIAGPILLGAAKGGIALRATPELIGEIAQDPTFSKELEETLMLEVILKRFEEPDEVSTFEKGKFELLQVGGMTIGRATYEPGWKWSVHVGQGLGWVVGDEPYVSIHLLGASDYAAHK